MADQILYFYNARGYEHDSRIGAAGATPKKPLTPEQLGGQVNRFDGKNWQAAEPDDGDGVPLSNAELRATPVPVTLGTTLLTEVNISTVTTDGTDGAVWVAFASRVCTSLEIVNNTDAVLEYRRKGAGAAMGIKPGATRMIKGLTNADEIEVRRRDTTATAVLVEAETFLSRLPQAGISDGTLEE